MTSTLPVLRATPSRIASRTTVSRGRNGPGAERINQAYTEFCESATIKAVIIGQMLREQCAALCGGAQNNQHTDENATFTKWLQDNCRVPERTAYRWMEMARRTIEHALLKSLGREAIDRNIIEVDAIEITLSEALTMPLEELPKQALEARQLLFDFADDKTMKECMALVMTGDKEAHAITRAHNGKHAKGAGGSGDRKAFAQFTATKLQHITTFVNSKMPKTEQALIVAATVKAIENWPKWFIEGFVDKAKQEMKLSDEERAARRDS